MLLTQLFGLLDALLTCTKMVFFVTKLTIFRMSAHSGKPTVLSMPGPFQPPASPLHRRAPSSAFQPTPVHAPGPGNRLKGGGGPSPPPPLH